MHEATELESSLDGVIGFFQNLRPETGNTGDRDQYLAGSAACHRYLCYHTSTELESDRLL